jgi:hypothetical protein
MTVAGWLTRGLPGDVAADDPGLLVRLARPRLPESDAERAIQVVLAEGPMPLDRLVEAATARLIDAERALSGGATDVALWGEPLYALLVRETVDELAGSVLQVG